MMQSLLTCQLIIPLDYVKNHPIFPPFVAKSTTFAPLIEKNIPKFRNRISYSFDEKGSDLRQIENDFYLSGITNYSKKAAMEKVKEKVGCSKTSSKTYYFKIGGPNKFYQTYKKQ